MEGQTLEITKITWVHTHINTNNQNTGKLGLSECPGKNLAKGRSGRPLRRDILKDLTEWKNNHNVSLILCLLNDYEIRTVGLNDKKYKQFCQQLGIQLIQYPIMEMSIPEQSIELDKILSRIVEIINTEGQNVVVHCRGGIGRAGTIACALLKLLGVQSDPHVAVQYVRSVRDKRCVESRKQYDWIRQFYLR